jgi:putative toxin-antitoxin system antitoxin component (TIGR02293 family)
MPPDLFNTMTFADNLAMAALVRDGLPSSAFKAIAGALGLEPIGLSTFVQINRRTLARRLSNNARLKPDESERALRLGRLLQLAQEVFEDREAAARWFRQPLRGLGGATPLEACATEPGAREVEQVLGRIEHGVFS